MLSRSPPRAPPRLLELITLTTRPVPPPRESEPLPRHLGSRLRRLRLGSQLSQLELATRMGFPGQIVTEVERGEQAPTERYLERLALALELPPQQIYELWEQYRRIPTGAGDHGAADTTPDRADCPYRGLYAFREQDAALYHGRTTVVSRLIRAIGHSALAGVVGASGSGKSSLVQAGLIPVLRRQEEHWAVATFRPGASPYEALAGGLIELLHPDSSMDHNVAAAAAMSQRMQSDGISRTLEQIAHRLGRPLLLFADQFEELFTHCRSEEVVQEFLDHLADLAMRHPGATSTVKLVLTLRGDFYGQAVAHRRFSDVLQDHIVNLPPMIRSELRSAIVEPARARQLALDDGLVERILDDVGNTPGNLPLLEFALTLLWERQSNGRLTHAAYEMAGEVAGAVATRAEEVYGGLSPQQQDTARQLLTRLVRVAPIGGEGEDTRRRTPVSELADLARVDDVMIALTAARLLVSDADEQGRPTIEVAHEAVIRNWDRLRTWLDGDRQFLLWQQRTRRRFEDWQSEQQDPANALHGRLLAEAEGWLQSRGVESVAADLREFVRASADLRTDEERRAVLTELERLLTVAADELPVFIARLSEHRGVVEERIGQVLRGEAALRSGSPLALSDGEAFRLRLFLAATDAGQADWIIQHLHCVGPGELGVARGLLSPFAVDVARHLWSAVGGEARGPDGRLRAAVLLGGTDAGDPRLIRSADAVTAELLAQDQLQLQAWLDALGNGAQCLLGPLVATAVDDGVRETLRETAVSLLHQVAGSRGDLLAEVAVGGPEHAYPEIVRWLEEAPDSAVREEATVALRAVLMTPQSADLDETRRVRLGRRRAAAACTLLRFSESDGILGQLTTSPDPEFATQFAHQARRRGVSGPLLAGMLAESPASEARYHLLMGLGNHGPDEFAGSGEFGRLRDHLLRLHAHDDDPGVHSATRWLDRRWSDRLGTAEAVVEAAYDPSGRRGWFSGTPHGTRLTFSVFRPGVLLSGSPETERERSTYESPQRLTGISRSFALCTAQVTRGEFEEFMADTGRVGLPDISEWSDKSVEPVVAPTWYEAADFCEWLTSKVGLHDLGSGYGRDHDDHPVLAPGWNGFRLPTEAEWEYACRAGTVTAYSFGSDRSLLDEYGWSADNSGLKTHEAGMLRPNPAGLFDIHGQCWEWCSDWYALYGAAPVVDPGGPSRGDRRVLRGGCWNLGARYARSACRNAHIPSNRNYYITFRIALTVPEPESAAPRGPNPFPWSG
ncbi:formylglycine-generating enzyme family protein [Streptomyces sp. WM6349]|uniref:formylglycine-generating enzyme family protein n=1 Tax=Streptomyces sp. WM6349 TaxID=1415552 RepID=UPI002D21DA10|nr:formylglycine-generating enzyme family protein [Streptomyces sp. WM6349]